MMNADARSAEEIARRLTATQKAELLSYDEGEGFMPPLKASCAKYLWSGIMPRGLEGPFFLLKRAHGACVYEPTPLGWEVRSILNREGKS